MPLFIPITKVNIAQRLVHGTLSEEIPDKTGEILDYETSKPAFEEWSRQFHEASGGKSLGNVRAMHSNVAAGKLTDIYFDDENKRIEGVAKVVDEDAWQKVLEGVYTGFSIGGGYAKRWPDAQNPELMRYTPTLSEVSLVDNPAVPTARFSVIKSDGSTEIRQFSQGVMKEEFSTQLLCDALYWYKKQAPEEVTEHVQALLDYLEQSPEEKAEKYERGSSMLYKQLQKTVEELHKRIDHLEALPVAPRGILKSLQKTQDYHDA